MATENRGVMVYLNPDIERELERYCIDNDITRKNKEGIVLPSLGTGIVQYLKSTLLSTAPRTVLSPLLGAVPHSHSSTSLSDAPSNRLSTEIKAEILELIAESNTGNTPNTVLTREEVLAIAKEEIDRALGSIAKRAEAVEAEITDLKTMLANLSSPSPLAYVPSPQEVENAIAVTPPQDPTNWEPQIAELSSKGMSSSQIADGLNLLGFTNTKGGAVSRQSVESYLSRRPGIKAIYENARKKGAAVSSTSG